MVNGVRLISVDTWGADVGNILLQVPESLAIKMVGLKMLDKKIGEDLAIGYLVDSICGMGEVEKVIFNGNTTIVFWNDHTKTVVKCQDGDTFSEETGIALCFMKKMLGNKGNYNKVLREALEKGERK